MNHTDHKRPLRVEYIQFDRQKLADALEELAAVYDTEYSHQDVNWWLRVFSANGCTVEDVIAGIGAHEIDPDAGKCAPQPVHILQKIEERNMSRWVDSVFRYWPTRFVRVGGETRLMEVPPVIVDR